MSDEQAQWLDAEQQRIWRSYLMASAHLSARLDADLRPFGLDLNEYEVLVCLSEDAQHSMRMSELAEATHQSRSRLTHTVTRMEGRGLVTREAASDDRRGVRANLTRAGFDLLATAAPGHAAGVRRYLVDPVSDKDFQALGRVMDASLRATARR